MHPSTEDLLTIRDGEPMDAALAEACAAPKHLREVERLHRMRHALCELPDLTPPSGVWERVAAAEPVVPGGDKPRLRLAARVGIAAAVAIAALVVVAVPRDPELPSEAVRATPPAGNAPAPLTRPLAPASYASLIQESARLERELREISYQRPVMRGSTASTIVGLEDRIAFIDEQLTYGAARGLREPQRAALWGERVELMNALVHVRYAQSQRTGF